MKTQRTTFVQFLHYVRRPHYVAPQGVVGWPARLRLLWRLFSTKIPVTFGLALLMTGLTMAISKLTGLRFAHDLRYTGWTLVVLVVGLAPLFEEALFRAVLRLTPRRMVAVAFLLGLFLTAGLSVVTNLAGWVNVAVKLLPMLGLPLLAYGLTRSARRFARLEAAWARHFRLIFYAVALLFGLAHLSNYANPTAWHYVLAPLLTLPQLFSGLFLGYVRMRYGIGYAVALHALNNSIPAGFIAASLLLN